MCVMCHSVKLYTPDNGNSMHPRLFCLFTILFFSVLIHFYSFLVYFSPFILASNGTKTNLQLRKTTEIQSMYCLTFSSALAAFRVVF